MGREVLISTTFLLCRSDSSSFAFDQYSFIDELPPTPTSRLIPRVLQKGFRRWSVPWIQLYRFRNEVPIRRCRFIVFRLGERESLSVLIDPVNCTSADCQALRVCYLFKTLIEWPEAPDLLNKHPKPVVLVIKGDICWNRYANHSQI